MHDFREGMAAGFLFVRRHGQLWAVMGSRQTRVGSLWGIPGIKIDIINCSLFSVSRREWFRSPLLTRVVVSTDQRRSPLPTTLSGFDYLPGHLSRRLTPRVKIVLVGGMRAILLEPPQGRDEFVCPQFPDTLNNGTPVDAGYPG